MTPDAINSLDKAVPGVRHERRPPDNWPGELVIVSDRDELAGEIDDDLFGDAEQAEVPVLWSEDLPDLRDVEAEMPEVADVPDLGGLTILTGQLGGTLGTDFPGAPGGVSVAVPQGSVTRRLPTDLFAFYLPWHEFPLRLWGIYLIVQGISAFGGQIHSLSRRWLSRGEANRLARMFLFHHEAYHNVAETFAARLEVSHRQPCYVAGFRKIWRHGFGTGLHEEGLADAYAYEKVRRNAFGDVIPKGRLRTFKRGVAAIALQRLMRVSPSPYNSSLPIVSGAVHWNDAEHEFQESNHAACGLRVPPSAPSIWFASGYAMHPSLGRNRNFSYVIDRRHPSLRHAVKVPYFSRTEFVRRLKIAVGGHEVGGGKHPKWVSSAGKRISVPGHRELARGTCRAILRQFGLNVPLTRFIGAMDNELAALQRQSGTTRSFGVGYIPG